MGKLWLSLSVSFALLVVVVLLAAGLGTESVSFARALYEPESVDHAILFQVRLPRIALSAIAGAGLAAVGVAFQALLRNPLAEPYILGVSGGAALGATIVIALGIPVAALWASAMVPAAAMLGGIAATALVYLIARSGGEGSATSMLLAGVIVNAIASSLITFIKTLVSAAKAQDLLFWLMGFIDVPSTTTLVVIGLYVAVGCTVLVADAGRLNLLSLGDEPAQHLGVNVRRLERRIYLVASLVVGAIVSATGLIGFVGLVVPHALRRILGPDHRVLLPTSIVVGATMLVLCDLAARAAFRWLGTEPPVGAVTALIGGPLFLLLLRRRAGW
jgi:iron complex transport system permease protein